MLSASTAKSPSDPAVMGSWSAYQMWACTARHYQQNIDRLTRWSLRLAIAGAIIATAAGQIGHVAPVFEWLPRVLGAIGAAVVTLAAYLSRQAQSADRDGIVSRCRAAAESMKSAIYLYRASAPPFDGPKRASQLRESTEKLIRQMERIEPRQPPLQPPPELGPLTIDGYISERVHDQVQWYRKRAKDHQDSADLYRSATSVLMAVSALLAIASGVSQLSAWAPVVATTTAAITAHLQNRRYQALIALYQATALRLELTLAEWAASAKTDGDKADRDAFILECEQTIARENGAWVGLWSRTPVGQPEASSG